MIQSSICVIIACVSKQSSVLAPLSQSFKVNGIYLIGEHDGACGPIGSLRLDFKPQRRAVTWIKRSTKASATSQRAMKGPVIQSELLWELCSQEGL